MAWIDYQKAFDSVPHKWLIKTLHLYGVNGLIVHFLQSLMKNWSTKLILNTENETINIGTVNIKNGIFQGDSMSPLLFCMSLFPLTNEMRNMNKGYLVEKNTKPISHLFYIDDLKLYARSENELADLIRTSKTFSEDIGMNFGLNKCAKVTIKGGKVCENSSIASKDLSSEIRSLGYNAAYKYLGIYESDCVQHKMMKDVVSKEYTRRVRKVLESELTGKNKFIAIGSLAQPV